MITLSSVLTVATLVVLAIGVIGLLWGLFDMLLAKLFGIDKAAAWYVNISNAMSKILGIAQVVSIILVGTHLFANLDGDIVVTEA